MSTRCSVLYNKSNKNSYHFYFEQADDKYCLETEGNGFNLFLQKVGKLLDGCPFSDRGVFLIDLSGEGKNKTIKPENCPHIKIKKVKKLKEGVK